MKIKNFILQSSKYLHYQLWNLRKQPLQCVHFWEPTRLYHVVTKYASLAGPLEESVKGIQGAQSIKWTSDLLKTFHTLQEALKNTRTLTITGPTDKLVMTVDASPYNSGISATLFVRRNGKSQKLWKKNILAF